MWRRLFLLVGAALIAVAACRTTPEPNRDAPVEITVSAAASLKDAFTELARLYEARNEARVRFNFGASGVLQKQIEQGAPVDVFASAGARQMDELAAKGLVLADTRRDFARNALVLVVPADAPARLADFAQLAQASVRRVAVGNPQTVPAGQYTEQLLTNLKLWEPLRPKLVLAEDVRQVLDYVARGEVDAGVVYASDAAAAQDRVVVAARADPARHDAIRYPVAVVRDSHQTDAARRFVQLLLSPEGQAVLTRRGFLGAP
ncbi:MAG TPA: molybdate ABC transporter substrate-binding protein [Pyrinomonadaceae bacterium]|jgi:molybdate transport system substrate-binding protein